MAGRLEELESVVVGRLEELESWSVVGRPELVEHIRTDPTLLDCQQRLEQQVELS